MGMFSNLAKPIGSMFGIDQKDDPTYNPKTEMYSQASDQAKMGGDARMNHAISDYGSGNVSFEDALRNAQAGNVEGAPGSGKNAAGQFILNDAQIAEMRDRLATGATTGSRYASEQVRNDPLSSGLFGQGGLQDRLGDEEQRLSSQGYSLQQPDHEAYGQVSGDISRQFGQQEQDTSNALARRGLAGGSSGAASAAFSGLQGNKNEMLAKAQTDIAQRRMADTNQRVQQARQTMAQLGTLGQNAIQNQFGRQQAGRQQNLDQLNKTAGIESNANDQGRQANEDAIGHKSKNIADAWSEGKYSGTKSGESDATASWMKMGGSSSMGMSDENNKENITDGAPKVRKFLSGIANSHDYSVVPKGKTQGNDPQSKSQGGGKPMWGSMIQQPNADGTYTPSAKENANLEQNTSGLGGNFIQDGSGGGSTGGATSDSGLTSLFGGGGGAGAGESGSGGMGELMSMFSDRNDKKDIHGADSEIERFMDSVHPHEYEYKDSVKDNPLAGPGKHVSPMAQELEKTDLGKQMVIDTPDGKVVDYGKGFGAILAAVGDLHKRLGREEGKKK